MKNKEVQEIPLFLNPVQCGFPSPADGYMDTTLDLNEKLISKPAATFFIKAKGDSMIGAGIYDGDLIIIDRSVKPKSGHVVLAILQGEFTLKRLVNRKDGVFLCAENPKYSELRVTEEMDFQVWGVAIHCIHKLL